MFEELIKKLTEKGVSITHPYDDGYMVMKYGDAQWDANLDGYDELYKVKLVLNSSVGAALFA